MSYYRNKSSVIDNKFYFKNAGGMLLNNGAYIRSTLSKNKKQKAIKHYSVQVERRPRHLSPLLNPLSGTELDSLNCKFPLHSHAK